MGMMNVIIVMASMMTKFKENESRESVSFEKLSNEYIEMKFK